MIRLNKIELKNWMVFDEAVFEFDKFTNIVGTNGVGKSSILKAIYLLLYNRSDRVIFNFVTKGKEEGFIQLNFTHVESDNEYQVSRTIGKRGTKFLLEGNGLFLETWGDIVRVLIELGLEQNQCQINFVESGSLTSELMANPKTYFNNIFNLSRYSNLDQSLRSIQNDLEGLMAKTDWTNKELESKKEKLESSIKNIEDTKAEILKVKARYEEVKPEYDRLSSEESLSQRQRKVDITTKLNAAYERRKTIIEEINDLSDKRNQLLVRLGRSSCPTCGQELENKDIIDEKINKVIEQIDTKEYLAKEKLKVVDRERDQLFKEKESLNELEDLTKAIPIFSEYHELHSQLIKLEHYLVAYEKEAELLIDKIQELEKMRGEDHKIALYNVSRIREAFSKMGPILTSKYMKLLERYTAEYSSMVLNKRVSVITDENASIFVSDGDTELPFKSLCSGEQAVIALVIKLTIHKFFSKTGFLILDEPTINMAPDTKKRLAELISDFDNIQFFVVSHDDTFDHMAENTIMLGEF